MLSSILLEKGSMIVEQREKPALVKENDVLVKVQAAGICGSDLHYYFNGAVGSFAVKQPYVLGHELCGVVEAVGAAVNNVKPGDQVAVDPNIVCHECDRCRAGHSNQCRSSRFLGSASTMPHQDGGFREYLNVTASQCIPTKAHLAPEVLAFAEPLAVVLQALSNFEVPFVGKKVLVTGAGPIGCLAIAMAKIGGATEIVVSDISDAALERAAIMGATKVVNSMTTASQMDEYKLDKGHFDICVECSGAVPAVHLCIECVAPKGIISQVGVLGKPSVELPVNLMAAKEIKFCGSFRSGPVFEKAVALLESGQIDPKPLISHQFPLVKIEEALNVAHDKSVACKVIITM